MTEDELDQIEKITNQFWLDFSKLCNDALKKMPPEYEDYLSVRLSEKTSFYGRGRDNFLARCQLADKS